MGCVRAITTLGTRRDFYYEMPDSSGQNWTLGVSTHRIIGLVRLN